MRTSLLIPIYSSLLKFGSLILGTMKTLPLLLIKYQVLLPLKDKENGLSILEMFVVMEDGLKK
jgi:hypothetical protein